MAIRKYDFIVGPETSTLPTADDPSADSENVNLGYLNDRSYWGEAVASYAALRALTSTQRIDNQVRQVDTGSPMELWKFDSASTATDDGATILLPNDLIAANPGRWLVMTSGGGGGGGGSTGGIDTLIQKNKLEKFGYAVEALDSSISESAQYKPLSKQFSAVLLKTASSGAAITELVWSPKYANDSDPNYDSATGWTAESAAASVGTTAVVGQFTVGSAAVKFDKNGTATTAQVVYDRSSANLAMNTNTRVWCYVYLPSITQLTNVYVGFGAASSANSTKWSVTTQYDGSALAIGLNLLFFDLTTTGTTVGTGWLITDLARVSYIGVTTSVAAQTYTGIAFDALYFSYRFPEDLGVIGSEFTLFDTSNRESIIVAGSNTRHDGRLTITANLSSSYTGGATITARGRVQRITLEHSGGNMFLFDTDATFSGGITTTQEVRSATFLRESLTGTWDGYIDVIPVQSYKVTTVGGSTLIVSDPVNQITNLKNGDTIHIFRPQKIDGKFRYRHIATRAMTADATYSSPSSTLTVVTTSVAVGDVVCKRHLSGAKISGVAEAASDTPGDMTLLSDPDGVQLVGSGINYPYREYVWAHWKLGGINTADASRNILGNTARAFNVTGAPTVTAEGYLGRAYAFTTSSSSDYFSIPAASSLELRPYAAAGTTTLQGSFWFYYTGTDGDGRVFIGKGTLGGNGWNLYIPGTASNMVLNLDGVTSVLRAVGAVGWHHCFYRIQDGVSHQVYIDGVGGATTATVMAADAGQNLIVGNAQSLTTPMKTVRIMDSIIWRNAPVFSTADINSIYNGGLMRILGEEGPILRYKYQNAALSGTKYSMKAQLTRTTTAVNPIVFDFGAIKVS